jgi:hypothetical protein
METAGFQVSSFKREGDFRTGAQGAVHGSLHGLVVGKREGVLRAGRIKPIY